LRFSKQIIVWISFISIRVPFNLSYFIYWLPGRAKE
jgi:hypothetical protein